MKTKDLTLIQEVQVDSNTYVLSVKKLYVSPQEIKAEEVGLSVFNGSTDPTIVRVKGSEA